MFRFTFKLILQLEPNERLELSLSAWKADVLPHRRIRQMAGVEGLEPTSLVLETKAQPLYQTPTLAGAPRFELGISGSKPDALPLGHAPIMVEVDGVAPPECYHN